MEGHMRARVLFWTMVGFAFAAEAVVLHGDPGKDLETACIGGLIKQLGDDKYAKREAASKELVAIGKLALDALRKAAACSGDLEIRQRAERCVQAITDRVLAVAAKKEIERLQGTWYRTSLEAHGLRESGEDKDHRYTFAGDRWLWKWGDIVVQAGTFNADFRGAKWTDISGTRGRDRF
jgi:hypothetical protein